MVTGSPQPIVQVLRTASKDGGERGVLTLQYSDICIDPPCMMQHIKSPLLEAPSHPIYTLWCISTVDCLCDRYNGIGNLLPLQLGRIPSLRALFLQGTVGLNGHATPYGGHVTSF